MAARAGGRELMGQRRTSSRRERETKSSDERRESEPVEKKREKAGMGRDLEFR